MTNTTRTIDPERAGGAGDPAGNGPRGAEPMSVEDAEEHVERLLGWRTVLGRSDQAALALLGEVRRLKAANSKLALDALAIDGQAMELSAEVERLRKAGEDFLPIKVAYNQHLRELHRIQEALPEIAGCQLGDVEICQLARGEICCVVRDRMRQKRLLPQPEWQDEEDGT